MTVVGMERLGWHVGFATLALLGVLAGGTIFIGLLAGRWPPRRPWLRSGLGMLAAGILVYLLVEILGEAAGSASQAWQTGPLGPAVGLSVLLVGGFALGLVGLTLLAQQMTVWLNRRAEHRAHQAGLTADLDPAGQLGWTIAAGIGLHNLSEGLAIGQSAASGRTALAVGLVIGFALHNSTEGFAILGPAVGAGQRVSWARIGLYGTVAGGPTFLGVLLGGVWTSTAVSVAVLATAGGALLYVIGQILAGLRRQSAQVAIMVFLAAGFALGWGTELVATTALNPTPGGSQNGCTVAADGDRSCPDTASAAGGADPGPALDPGAQAAQRAAAQAVLHERPLTPVIEPNGVAHYTLRASTFPWELYPGKTVTAWGYNGQLPGPLLRFTVGQQVAITVLNQLPQPTTVHWHGLAVPADQDGVPDTGPVIAPGASYTYHFTVTDQMIGTHWYHTHVNDDFQTDAGLHGPLIVDPAPNTAQATAVAAAEHADQDVLYTLSAAKLDGADAENAFTMDGKAWPEAPQLPVARGQRVLIRMVNDSAEESHTMHLHGNTFTTVALDGNLVPAPQPANTINLGPGQTADVLFTADNPGRWMLHCHVLDHTINPGPAGDGDATHIAEMGGLSTFLNVS